MEKQKQIEYLWKQAMKKTIQGKMYLEKEPVCYMEHTDGVPLIRFRAFDCHDFVNACFSTRFGGVSKGVFSELNLGFGRGDSDDAVVENFKAVCAGMGVNVENLVLSDQVHDTKVLSVTKEHTCQERIQKKLRGIDGLITGEAGVCLTTAYADCVPLFFADTKNKVVASSHSGWKGTVGKIATITLKKMQAEHGSDVKDIVAVIGPSICQNCYEVSEDVIEQFCQVYSKEAMQEIAFCSNEAQKKYQLDLWAANYIQMLEAGVKKENIHVSALCTCCNPELLFSHRYSNGKRGNLRGFISIRKAKHP